MLHILQVHARNTMLTVIAQQIRQHVPGIIQLGSLHCIIESFLIISQVHVADCSVQVRFGIVWIVFYILIALPATPGCLIARSCCQLSSTAAIKGPQHTILLLHLHESRAYLICCSAEAMTTCSDLRQGKVSSYIRRQESLPRALAPACRLSLRRRTF